MRSYEQLFIVRPDASEEEIDGFVEQLRPVITEGGGTLDKVDKWGVRRLAYRVAKREEGYYVLMQFTSGPSAVKELERRGRVSDLVLKYLTTRTDEKLKRLEKRRKQREKRARRKPAVAAAGPGRPAEAAPAEPVPGQPALPAEEA
jgi:small subunit ribosomal protein S6